MSNPRAQGGVSDFQMEAMQRQLAELHAERARRIAAGEGVAGSAPSFNVQATPFVPPGGGGGGGAQPRGAPAATSYAAQAGSYATHAASYATPGAASYANFSQNGASNHYAQAQRGGDGGGNGSYEDDYDNDLYYEDDDDGYDEGYDEDYFDEGNMDFAPMDDGMGMGGGWGSSNFSGEVGVTTATPAKVTRREVGDFEQLRLAKMGDLQSFQSFEAVSHVDITNLTDNKGRNALHYAADGGNVELVEYLASKRVPAITDYKDMTPMDIAVLTNDITMQNALADKFEKLAEQQLRDSQRMSADQMHLHAVKTFAPAPPKFTISKPTPPKADQTGQHLFWRDVRGQTEPSPAQPSPFKSNTKTVPTPDAEVMKKYKLCATDSDGDDVPFKTVFYHPGASEKILALCGARVSASVVEVDGSTVGAVMSFQLGGRLVGPSGNSSTTVSNPTYVSDLAVTPSYKGKGVTVALLDDVLKSVKGTAVFHTAYHIPPAAVGTIKWFQRTFNPIKLFRNRALAEELLPEFFEYDEFLRADYAAKGEITESVDSVEDLAEWCAIDGNSPKHVSGVHEFLVKALTTGQVDAKIAYIPESEADTREVILGGCSHAFARVSGATGSVVDFVGFRVVSPHEAKSECVAGQEDPNGSFAASLTAVCVFAVIPTKKGHTKMMSLLHLCNLLHCSSLLVPNLFGFTDMDTAQSHFEELHQHRELLYILKDRNTSLFPATPMVKTFVPLAIM